MPMRFFPHDDPVHREANELLPWFVNGTLEPAARSLVAHHLQECMACHQESIHLQRLQAAVQDEGEDLEASRALQRLKQRIAPPSAVQHEAAWRRWFSRWHQADPWLRGALLAQFAVVLMLTVGWAGRADSPDYHTLSAPPSPTMAATGAPRITIVFDGAQPERDLRALLLSVRAQVVDGPSPEGAYVVAVPPGQQASALTQLRGHRAILLAEPIQTAQNAP
jgi:hypothetical protein